jgi:arylformamidase
VPLEDLVGTARVLRIRCRPGETIEADSIDLDLLDEHRVILDSGWHSEWGSERYYRDFPVVSPELARSLVERSVRCLVVDLPLTLEVHEIMLGAGACQVENVINLNRIRADKVELIALPLRIVGIDAAPARVIVMEDADREDSQV